MPPEKRIIYFDAFAGASGDMLLGALLDLGVDFELIRDRLRSLPLSGYALSLDKVSRGGISATKVHIEIDEKHPHRNLECIERIVDESGLEDSIKELSRRIFRTLAAAEAKIHGIGIDAVELHEVGSVDAIIDVVGNCLALDGLRPDTVLCSPLPLGAGKVEASHGVLPVPAPATLEILRGVPIQGGDRREEMVTPTGAAILKTVVKDFAPIPPMTVERIGYGAGTRNPPRFPNVLRAIEGSVKEDVIGLMERICVIETNVDDTSPQICAYLAQQALGRGALDVFLTPVTMKKGRPGSLITILCSEEKWEEMVELLCKETETIGCRITRVERVALPREIRELDSTMGKVRFKVAYLRGEIAHFSPEYEDCRIISDRTGMALRKVMDKVKEEASQAFRRNRLSD